MPKSRPWLNIQPNETVVIEIEDVRGEQEFSGDNGKYSKWMYDVLHNGQEKTLGATKGLQTVLEAHSLQPGDVISITRSGAGLSTRWAVAFERGDTKGAVRTPNTTVRPGATIDDLWANYDGLNEALKLRHPEFQEETVAIMAAVLCGTSLSMGLLFPGFGSDKATPGKASGGKTTPTAFVRSMMTKAQIPISQQEALARMLFGEHVTDLNDVTRDDANLMYVLTENGENPEPLKAQYENMIGEEGDDDLPF
jgi:hypothetical protein